MPFNSVAYLAFLVVAVLLFWLLPVRFRRPFVWIASLVFYATWGLIFIWVPLLVASLVYLFGRQIQSESSRSRTWMWVGIICVLCPLVFFKYGAFFLSLSSVAGVPVGLQSGSFFRAIAFPLGISFYTFEAIAYLVDVRQGRLKMPGFFDLCLFFFFWPNILCGPIVRARELMPQLSFQKSFEPQFFFDGLDRIIWGLVQKSVIANMLGIWVDKGFAVSAAAPSTLDGWFLAIAFGLQIYFDFSAYTNIAIGAARLLGVTLPENFRFPYHASTPPEFWARWHMTLSRWIRDYLFFPINAKFHGAPLPLYVSLLAVMAVVGLWHGAGWNFILWGLLHGTYLVSYRVYEAWKTGRRSALGDSRFVAGVWRAVTLVAVTVAWVAFRAVTLSKAGVILSSMFYRFSRGAVYSSAFYVFTLLVLLFSALEPSLARELNALEERGDLEPPSPLRAFVRPIAYLCGLLLFLVFDEHNAQFIYSQF